MKIYVSALLLTIAVVLHFGVSSSMPSSPPNQPASPPRNQRRARPYHRIFKDRPVFNKETGELVAIFHNQRRFKISDIVFEEKDPNGIPDLSWLTRSGRNGLLGRYLRHNVYYGHDLHSTGVTIEPQRNDLVVDLTGQRIKGMFRDPGQYYEIVSWKY